MTTVLLVDDDKHLQKVYKSIFPLGNFDIIAQAYDGVQAIDIYRDLPEKPDVVLMDQRMPMMDGITATKKLVELDPDVRVIFLSADKTSKAEAIRVGATRFLSKPVNIETLFDTIEKTARR